MSGTPNKRLHEEGGGHSSASKYPPHEDSGVYPNVAKLTTSSSTNEYHNTPFDTVQDARMPKIPRAEARDADRRSPLLPTSYRISSSSNDSHSDHPVASENRNELRDYKDNSSRDFKVDTKVEPRELYHQGAKGDKDIRFDSRGGDDTKETKYDRGDAYPDYKGEPKDVYSGGGNSHFNWKELKEQHRGKRYPDNTPPGGNVDLWHSSSRTTNLHGPAEVRKEGSTTMEDIEAHEAVGENKIDIKGGDDKFKEKDRKRKDGKQHREWGGERDKERSDRRQQLGNSSNESPGEEREAEKWERERERKDLLKEKDKLKDREKDHTKREVWSAAEKEGLDPEKDAMDVSGRAMEQENQTLEQKKPKDHDGWKNDRGEANKDRRKERDNIDVEGERPEKRSRCYDKESDDGGCLDAEGGGTEREKGVFNYGVQQRKRMLRPRGSPQVGNREPRFRSRTQDNEGSQGKPDVSTVVYRVGECMQELIKSWKEFESQADKMGESSQNGPTLEIRIPAEHVTATNRQVRGGQLWGTDIYTDDSDLVAVLMHTGYCRPTASPPPPAIQELRATVKVLPPQDCYISTLRNNVRSRAWGAAIGCSYRVQRCCIVKKGGGTIDLEPCLTHTSAVEPTLAPVVVERTMTTRAAASNALRQQRFVREVTIQYNLCNEPWIKYSISAVADKGLKKPFYTSARLKKGEVLYLESHSCRYELCFNGEKMVKATNAHETETDTSQSQIILNSNTTSTTATATVTATANGGERNASQVEGGDNSSVMMDVFRWSRCKKPLPQKVMHSIGIPLPIEHLEVLEENLDWEDIQWSQAGVWIAGKEYPLVRVHFLSPN